MLLIYIVWFTLVNEHHMAFHVYACEHSDQLDSFSLVLRLQTFGDWGAWCSLIGFT